MTSRQRLQLEVQRLTETEAAEVLAFLALRARSRRTGQWPPSFAGIGHSGRNDLGARSEEILRAELGRR